MDIQKIMEKNVLYKQEIKRLGNVQERVRTIERN